MDLTQLANLGEFIGGVAVLVTLMLGRSRDLRFWPGRQSGDPVPNPKPGTLVTVRRRRAGTVGGRGLTGGYSGSTSVWPEFDTLLP